MKTKYKLIKRRKFVQLSINDAIVKWLNRNDRSVIMFKDIWHLAELASIQIENDNHLKTVSIKVKDQSASKTIREAEAMTKKINKKLPLSK